MSSILPPQKEPAESVVLMPETGAGPVGVPQGEQEQRLKAVQGSGGLCCAEPSVGILYGSNKSCK